MEKVKFVPLPRAEADKLIRRIYRRFFELRQTKIVKGSIGNEKRKTF